MSVDVVHYKRIPLSLFVRVGGESSGGTSQSKIFGWTL